VGPVIFESGCEAMLRLASSTLLGTRRSPGSTFRGVRVAAKIAVSGAVTQQKLDDDMTVFSAINDDMAYNVKVLAVPTLCRQKHYISLPVIPI